MVRYASKATRPRRSRRISEQRHLLSLMRNVHLISRTRKQTDIAHLKKGDHARPHIEMCVYHGVISLVCDFHSPNHRASKVPNRVIFPVSGLTLPTYLKQVCVENSVQIPDTNSPRLTSRSSVHYSSNTPEALTTFLCTIPGRPVCPGMAATVDILMMS